MHLQFIVVLVLIIAVISNDSFPIDLKEIEHEDIYLVDKERKGRFIPVNQTTYLPNPIELIRAKKSSLLNTEKSADELRASITDDLKVKEKPAVATKIVPPTIREQKMIYGGEFMVPQNNYSCADSLFEPQTFGYPSFFQEQFEDVSHPSPFFINSPTQMLMNHDCCNFDKFTSNLLCIDEFFVPEENLFC